MGFDFTAVAPPPHPPLRTHRFSIWEWPHAWKCCCHFAPEACSHLADPMANNGQILPAEHCIAISKALCLAGDPDSFLKGEPSPLSQWFLDNPPSMDDCPGHALELLRQLNAVADKDPNGKTTIQINGGRPIGVTEEDIFRFALFLTFCGGFRLD